MRRLAALALLLLVGATVAFTHDGSEPLRYKAVLDDAFGLIEGADFKVGGVRVGRIEDLDVDRRTHRAIVTFTVERREFGSFRRDAFCDIKPQSLIGEYFLECRPGQAQAELPPGGTIPVEQTRSPIPVDLVNNILRRPYRERLRLIFNELGAGFAARGRDLNATIRRAVPALDETNRVLKILANNRRTLRSLAREAAVVLGELAEGREGVADFVDEAGRAAQLSAERRDAIAGSIRRLPPFLTGLRGTLADLGSAAREQTPALAAVRANADELTETLNLLGPFSEASRPAIRSLGRASETGVSAVRAARPTVAELRRFARGSGELARNLRMILEHLDDRDWAVERDPDSPQGRGYTGLEALLQYFYDQSIAINIFDERGYILKLNVLASECAGYTNAERARADRERTEKCNAALGPSQPGVNQPDPSPPDGAAGSAVAAPRSAADSERRSQRPRSRASEPRRDEAADGRSGVEILPGVPLPEPVRRLLDERPPLRNPRPLLDFLLGP